MLIVSIVRGKKLGLILLSSLISISRLGKPIVYLYIKELGFFYKR